MSTVLLPSALRPATLSPVTQFYDIAILGATAAGYAAASFLAAKGRRVVLVDAPRQSAESPLADWVPKDFFRLAGLPKDLAHKCGAAPFHDVIYHNASLTKRVEYRSRAQSGFVLRTTELLDAMRAACGKAGVTVRTSRTQPAIVLQEDKVIIRGSAQAVGAGFLIIAQGLPGDVVSQLATPMQHLAPPPMVAAALDIPLPVRMHKEFADALHVVETHDRSDLGMFFAADGLLHVRLISSSPASGTRAAELSAMVAGAQKARILPPDLHVAKARGAVWRPPAGVALELETHVAKRCLLAGTAGGFAESITGQTLTSSVRSAVLAAEAVLSAAKTTDPQEALIAFRSVWRRELTDYLRPPNTSLQMLLPLLFVNQQIVAKFTRALLYGQPI